MREVSGDIYDIIEISDTRTAFFLADATGHGVSAALITSIIHYNVENIMKETVNPAHIFNRLSDNLFETLQGTFLPLEFLFFLKKKEDTPIFAAPDTIQSIIIEKNKTKSSY